MQVDFFEYEEIVTKSCFGICDDEDISLKTPAYIDIKEENENAWIAKVTNNSGKAIGFIAVDNKIEILREDGNMEHRCDAILHNEDNIIFVELKEQRKDWIKDAVEDQLLATINIFKSLYNISVFKNRVAYVCNRRHPSFAYSHKEYMQKFRNEHNVRLIICRDIKIKGTML